jgi:pimeloyl-ACP methyl ester carboxylesterase
MSKVRTALKWTWRVLLGLLLILFVLAIIFRSWVAAQWDAVVMLGEVLDNDRVQRVTHRFTDEPVLEDGFVGGVPALTATPGEGNGPWPTIIFVNGAAAEGRKHPILVDAAEGLARAGYFVVVPDPPGLADVELSDRTLDGLIDVTKETLERDEVDPDRVSYMSVSAGTALSLIAAGDPRLRTQVDTVVGIAPYADLKNMLMLATTGEYRNERGERNTYSVDDYLLVALAHAVVAQLPEDTVRSELLLAVSDVDRDSIDRDAIVEQLREADLSPDAEAVVNLLANTDPDAFDALYSQLPLETQRGLETLSPLNDAPNVLARIELAVPPRDPYFPNSESQSIVDAAPNARITELDILTHAIPEPSAEAAGDVWALNTFTVRSLRSAST